MLFGGEEDTIPSSRPSESLPTIYETTQHQIPEDVKNELAKVSGINKFKCGGHKHSNERKNVV
jgi:hypothetical protein